MSLTPQVLFDARIYYGSLDATGDSNHVEFAGTWEDLDRTTFGSNNAKERVNGLADAAVNLAGFYDVGDLTKPDDVLWANNGSFAQPLTLCPTSGAVGTLAYLTKTMQTDYKPTGEVGKLFGWTADMAGNQPIARGQMLHPQGTVRTVTGVGTGVQLGAVLATQRMYANLHVLSIAGTATPTITVTIQSDTTNAFSAPTTRISFAAATALSGQALNVLGAVTDTWWRAIFTISGTSPSFLFAVSAGSGPK